MNKITFGNRASEFGKILYPRGDYGDKQESWTVVRMCTILKLSIENLTSITTTPGTTTAMIIYIEVN